MDTSIPQKQCLRCNKYKPATLEFFNAYSRSKDGLRTPCRECRKKEYYEHHEKNLQRSKDYQKRTGYSRQYSKTEQGQASQERYRKSHRERRNQQHKEWYANNKEHAQAYTRIYNRTYKEEIKQREQERRKSSDYLQKRRETGRRYAASNLERRRVLQHRRSIKMSSGKSFTLADVRKQYANQKGKCYYCHEKLTAYHIDHVIPLSRGGTNDAFNIVIACPACNMHKKDKIIRLL
jgi:hypothetical protein